MACVWKHPASKFWFARFTDERGVQRNRTTRQTDRRTAQTLADAWEHACRLAKRGELTEARSRAVVSEILERVSAGTESIRSVPANQFFGDWLAHKTSTKSAGTAERYETTVRQFLAHLGERAARPLGAIRPADLQNFFTARGKTRSAKTISVDCKTLSAAFTLARRQGLIDKNPLDLVELPKIESREREPFTPDQVRLLVDTATGDWRTAILAAYFLGARLGDVTNLQWRDFDLVAGTVSYRQQKTGEKVTAALHRELLGYLLGIAGDTAGPLTPSLANRITGGHNGLSAEFNRLMRQAGIGQNRTTQKSGRSFATLSFHSLRHGFESLLANLSVSAELRRELTGRASEATQRGYTHLQLETQRRAVDKLPSVLNQVR